MSRARAAVLDAVEGATGPSSLAELSAVTGLHANTLRGHLDGLVGDGLVRRQTARPAGRGRPAWLYRPVPGPGAVATEYAGLATTLAAAIARTSLAPTQDAVEAGTDWGRELARSAAGPAAPGPVAARRHLVGVLEQMGFDPQVDDESDPECRTVRLTRCPLLDAARRYPDVVCGVHLGIAKGALREYDADDSEVSLLPFGAPDACLLHLAAGAAASG